MMQFVRQVPWQTALVFVAIALAHHSGFPQGEPEIGYHPSKAIEDNSFFIEEAFNQEPGVVQHISTLILFSRPSKDALYSFTQEWPLAGLEHQIGYTIAYAFDNPGGSPGVGDVMLNYRYQLSTADDWAACSPRFSLILPSGSVDRGLGFGTTGFQIAIPASKRVSDRFIAHVNVVGTVVPDVRQTLLSGGEVQKTLTGFAAGGSLIWLAGKGYNFMIEAVTDVSGSIDAAGNVVHQTETLLSPGVRFAIDIGDLQIVPGLGLPVRFGGGDEQVGAFLYLSFEHPF